MQGTTAFVAQQLVVQLINIIRHRMEQGFSHHAHGTAPQVSLEAKILLQYAESTLGLDRPVKPQKLSGFAGDPFKSFVSQGKELSGKGQPPVSFRSRA